MVQLIYGSAATKPFSASALTVLLDKSRARNSLYEVTGLLVYHSGAFLQVLEGPEAGVDLIFSSISKDARHRNTKLFARQTCPRREFGDWSMSFEYVATMNQKVGGLVDYRRALPGLGSSTSEAKRYLRMFQEGLCRQR